MIKEILNIFIKKHPVLSQRLAFKLLYKDQFNVNLDLCSQKQKRVLISYITLTGFDFSNVQHASFFHLNQILHYFIQHNYCVDLCRMDDLGAYERLKSNQYDILFGFGPVYKKFCKSHNIPHRVCFIMENNPVVVEKLYQQRVSYFKERHPGIDPKTSCSRMGYFDTETFKLSTCAILMNSEYNATSFHAFFSNLFLINSNAIYNKEYVFDSNIIRGKIQDSRNRVLWFGSKGLIHKGLDILIDAIAQFPKLMLDCYGVDVDDKRLFNKLKYKNTIDCGKVNVLSDEFINEVVYRHNFCVLPSCSEGMSTAVATCMAHGIIPIITKECGYNDSPYIIQIDDYRIDTIKSAINSVLSMTNEEILEMRHNCYLYARNEFSLECFNNRFTEIMNQILL